MTCFKELFGEMQSLNDKMYVGRLEDVRKDPIQYKSMGMLSDWKRKKNEENRKFNEKLDEFLKNETPEQRESRHYGEDMEFLIRAISKVPKLRRQKLEQIIKIGGDILEEL